MNETNFRIDCDRAHLVMIINVNKSLRMIDLNNRDYIISMKCVNFVNDVISFLFIILKVNILHK